MIRQSVFAFVLTALLAPTVAGPALAQQSVALVPGTTILPFDDAPEESRALLNAIVGAMRGQTAADAFGPVTFEHPVMQNLRILDPFEYSGLNVTGFQIKSAELSDTTSSKTVAGIIHWFDEDTKRSAATSFGVIYRPVGEALFIHDLRVARVPPNQPRIALFLVPKDRVGNGLDAAGGFIDLLRQALENGIRSDADKTPWSGAANYLVLAFSLDRLANGDRLDLFLNLNKGNDDQRAPLRPPYQKLLDYSGYQVAVMELGLDLMQADPLRVEVYYTPTRAHPTLTAKPHLAGRYVLTGGN